METVGIITMHRVKNCGSLLQAYALQKKIHELGYSVEIIDYLYPNKNHLALLNGKQGNSFKRIIIKFLSFLIHFQKNRKMDSFMRKYLILSHKTYKDAEQIKIDIPKYDCYVTGSDQLWNPRFNCNDETFYMDFVPEGAKIISFATSCAIQNITDLKLKEYLIRYSKIGVREISSKKELEKLLNKPVHLNCDPTLLLNSTDIDFLVKRRKNKIRKPYVLFYILTYSYNPYPELEELISRIINQTGLYPVFLFGSYRKAFKYHAKNIYNAGPQEFVNLIRNANLVVTSSFHGLCFSLLQNKQFFALVKSKNDSNDERLMSLLKQLCLENRALEKENKYRILDQNEINYDIVNMQIQKLRSESMKYLQNSLGGING